MNPTGGIMRYWSDLSAGLVNEGLNVSHSRLLQLDRRARVERFLSIRNVCTSVDIVHSSYYRCIHNAHATRHKSIITAYDCIYERFRSGLALLAHRHLKGTALRKCDVIISISHSTKNDIIKYYNIDSDKIIVVPHSVSPIFKACDVIGTPPDIRAFDTERPFFFIRWWKIWL